MFGFKKKQEPSLRELCDAVAAHPDSVLVAVFERSDFQGNRADHINPEYLRGAIYDLVMAEAEDVPF